MAIQAYVEYRECMVYRPESYNYGICTIDEACPDYGTSDDAATASDILASDVASDVVPSTTGGLPTDDVCLDCYADEECEKCIGFTGENEAEQDQCMEEVSIEDACDAIFAPLCCRAATSGNDDCMAIQAYVDFVSCVVEDLSLCSLDDMDCAGVSGFGTAGNGSNPAVAISFSTAILTFVLGFAAAVAAGL